MAVSLATVAATIMAAAMEDRGVAADQWTRGVNSSSLHTPNSKERGVKRLALAQNHPVAATRSRNEHLVFCFSTSSKLCLHIQLAPLIASTRSSLLYNHHQTNQALTI